MAIVFLHESFKQELKRLQELKIIDTLLKRLFKDFIRFVYENFIKVKYPKNIPTTCSVPRINTIFPLANKTDYGTFIKVLNFKNKVEP